MLAKRRSVPKRKRRRPTAVSSTASIVNLKGTKETKWLAFLKMNELALRICKLKS